MPAQAAHFSRSARSGWHLRSSASQLFACSAADGWFCVGSSRVGEAAVIWFARTVYV